MADASKPINVQHLRSDREAVRIEGDLYRLAESIQRQLASPEATDVEYVVRLAISLLAEATGKNITFTDPHTGEYEEYRLWR